ncbi:hypothetical protein U1Q18_040722 [Sarracenia purpurea var. burkii]
MANSFGILEDLDSDGGDLFQASNGRSRANMSRSNPTQSSPEKKAVVSPGPQSQSTPTTIPLSQEEQDRGVSPMSEEVRNEVISLAPEKYEEEQITNRAKRLGKRDSGAKSIGAVKEAEEVDPHHEVKGGPEIRKETVPEVSNSGPKELSMDEDEDKGDEGGSGDGEQDDGISDLSGSDSVPEEGSCEQIEDANQGSAAIQVSLPDSSPACEGGVFTDSERRLSLALEDIREGNNGDEIFCAHHMFDKLPHNACSYLDANESKPGGILKSGNSVFVPDLGKEGNAGYVAVSEIQGLAVPLSKAHVGALRPPTGSAPRPSIAQGVLNRSWAKVVTSSRGPNLDGGFPRLNQRSSSGKLDYFEPKEIGIIDIEESLVDDLSWENCLVGYFLDSNLSFGLVRATAMSLWRHEGLLEVSGNESGFFFFKFKSLPQLDNILEKGP